MRRFRRQIEKGGGRRESKQNLACFTTFPGAILEKKMYGAKKKVEKLYNTKEFCKLDAVTRASFVKIPFSATTLSPRNGPAALDLAIVSLHVRLGIKGKFGKSGVDFFDAEDLVKDTAKSLCPLQLKSVPYVASDLSGVSAMTLSFVSIAATIFATLL